MASLCLIMNNPDPSQVVARGKLSSTMRIDITPESLADMTAEKAERRIITRKFKGTSAAETWSADPNFQELFQSVYDAAIITDMDGNIISANIRACGFFLFGHEEFSSLNIVALISGADKSLVQRITENLVQRFVLIEACYCLRKDGSFFPAEVAVNEIHLSGRTCLCFFVRDITLRREAEEQLRIEHNAIQNSHSGIVITDLQMKILYVNPAICRMWKYADPAELVNTNLRSLWKHDGDSADVFEPDAQQAEGSMREIIAICKDGAEFHAQIAATANRDTDGKLVGMVFSIVDVSDRKRAEDAEREAERRRVMLESLGAACHHLGQPATVLLANLGIMNRKISDKHEEIRPMITSSLEAAVSLSEILHKLNATNEYKTTSYLERRDEEGESSRILDIGHQ